MTSFVKSQGRVLSHRAHGDLHVDPDGPDVGVAGDGVEQDHLQPVLLDCLSRERRKAAASGHLQSPLQQSGHLVVAVALVVHEDAVVVAVLPRELQVREELLVELGALVRLMRLVLLVRSWCAWCACQLAR